MELVITLALLALLANPAGPQLNVQLLKGNKQQGTLESISGGMVKFKNQHGGIGKLPLSVIDRLVLEENKECKNEKGRLYFSRQQTLGFDQIAGSKNDGLVILRGKTERHELPLAGIYAFHKNGNSPEFNRDIAAPRPTKRDFLYLNKNGKIIKIAGIINRCSPQHLHFEFAGSERKISFKRIYGIIIGGKPANTVKRLPCRIRFTNGNLFDGQVSSADPVQLHFVHPLLGKIIFPWASIRELSCARDQSIDLVEARPISLTSIGPFGGKVPLCRNSTVDGQPLVINGRTFNRGICLIPCHRITFAVPTGFTSFQAFFGIADETGGTGVARFKVLVGDKVLYDKLIRGGNKAEKVRLAIPQPGNLVLVIDFGPDLHLGDHCIIAAPRLIALPEDK